jgi:hypothetical protein
VSEIRSEHVVSANASDVYRLLADLEGYHAWNPFTPRVRSTLVVGAPIELDGMLHGRMHHQVETVQIVEPGRRLAWGARMGGGLLLRTRRTQTIVPIDERRCRYVSEQLLEGPLAPLIRLLFGRTIQAGFDAVGSALAAQFADRP